MIPIRVIGEPYLSNCIKYREEFEYATEKTWEYVRSIGGETFFNFPGRRAHAIRFLRKEHNLKYNRRGPEGWNKPDNKKGISTPRKGSQAEKEMLELPIIPSTFGIYENIPLSLNYKLLRSNGEYESEGSQLLVGLDTEVTYFEINDKIEYFMRIPNYEKEIETIKKWMDPEQSKKLVIDENILNFKLPSGLEQLTPTKYKYLKALSDLQAEENELNEK